MIFQRTKIDAKMKTIIKNDWLKEFPSLKKSSPNGFSRLVGPIEISVGYSYEYGTEYRPGTSVCNLLNTTDFLYAVMSAKPKSRRCDIRWEQHEKGLYKEAVEEIKQLAPLPIEGTITLSQVIHAYRNYKGHICAQDIFEDPALIAAWCERPEVAKECLNWGLEAYKKRFNLPRVFDTYDEWYEHMLKRISDPKALQQLLNDQIVKFKLTKVPHEELIIDL
jgi:hypothetical protein